MKNLFLSFITLCSFLQLDAQSDNHQDIVKHTVAPKETIYSLSRAFNVHPKAIMAANPSLGPDFALKINDVVFIPIERVVAPETEASAEEILAIKKEVSTKPLPIVPADKAIVDKTILEEPKKKVAISKPVSNEAPTFTREISNNFYVVKSGESFSSIAKANNLNPKDLMALNSSFAPSFSLKPNDQIIVPKFNNDVFGEYSAPLTLSSTTVTEKSVLSNSSKKTHVVEKGQTLYAIGRLYNISPKELMRLNPDFAPAYNLKSNDVIMLSEGGQNGDNNRAKKIEKPSKHSNDQSLNQNKETTGIISELGTASNNSINLVKVFENDTLIPISYFKQNPEQKTTTNIDNSNIEKPFLKLIEHHVSKNESLLDIGNHYGILITNIMQLNQLKSVKLKEGQRLFIHPEWIQPATTSL